MTLLDLKKGESARIVEVKTDRALVSKLMVMGLRTGCLVQKVKNAPLKDPVEFAVGNTHLSINCRDAECVLIEKISL